MRDSDAGPQRSLVELETEIARLAQERDRYKAWCDAETHHIAAVRRECAEAVAALAAVQPLFEAARDLVEAHDKIRTDTVERLDRLRAVLSSFPTDSIAQPGIESPPFVEGAPLRQASASQATPADTTAGDSSSTFSAAPDHTPKDGSC